MNATNFISIEDFNLLPKYKDNPYLVKDEIAFTKATNPNDFLQKYNALQGLGYCGYFLEERQGFHPTKRVALLLECECGVHIIARAKDVKSGSTKSCGCKRFGESVVSKSQKAGVTFYDLQKIQRLENKEKKALEFLQQITDKKEQLTNTSIIEKNNKRLIENEKLRLIREQRANDLKLSNPNAVILTKYNKYISDSKKRRKGNGIDFNLTYESFFNLVNKNCTYCGKKALEERTFNGLDRIDSSLPYVESNVVSCCGDCNKMKFTKSYSDFINKAKQIALLHTNNY